MLKPCEVSFLFVNGKELTVQAKGNPELVDPPMQDPPIFFLMHSESGEEVYVNPAHVVTMVVTSK